MLLPAGSSAPYLMVITTYRLPEEKEWLLEAGSQRARALWAIEIVLAVLRAKTADLRKSDGGVCKCIGCSKECARLPEALLMDAARVACDTARSQATPAGMQALAEVLSILAGSSQCAAEDRCQVQTAPHIPHTAFQRFGETVKRAQAYFAEWAERRLMSRLLKAPPNFDMTIWRTLVLPFLWPNDLFDHNYPMVVDQLLSSAAERCQRTLS